MEKSHTGDVKIFTLTTLLELIGKVKKVGEDHYDLTDVLAIRMEPQTDSEGRPVLMTQIVPLSMLIEKDEKSGATNLELYFSSILKVSDPPEEMLNQYSMVTGSILAPPSKKIQMPVQ